MIPVKIVASSPIIQRGLSSLCLELGLRPECCLNDGHSLETYLDTVEAQYPSIWLVEDFFYHFASKIKRKTPDSLFVLYSHHQSGFDAGEIFCGEIQEGKDAKTQLEAITTRYVTISCNNVSLYRQLTRILNKRHRLILFLLSYHFTKQTICQACDIAPGTYNNYMSEMRRYLGMDLHELIAALFHSGLFNELRRDDSYSSKLAVCREISPVEDIPYAS
jgi:hypothetical protein